MIDEWINAETRKSMKYTMILGVASAMCFIVAVGGAYDYLTMRSGVASNEKWLKKEREESNGRT